MSFLVKPFGFAGLAERLGAYRAMCERTMRVAEADQTEVDAPFGLMRAAPTKTLPKGQSLPTMALVRQAVTGASQDLSAAEVADQSASAGPPPSATWPSSSKPVCWSCICPTGRQAGPSSATA